MRGCNLAQGQHSPVKIDRGAHLGGERGLVSHDACNHQVAVQGFIEKDAVASEPAATCTTTTGERHALAESFLDLDLRCVLVHLQ
jgi:hypothetical protein